MIFIGIDPEPSGAYCIWDTDKNVINFYSSNTKGFTDRLQLLDDRYFQYKTITEKLFEIDPGIVSIEKVWIIPDQSSKSMEKFIGSYWAWITTLISLNQDYNLVAPRTWKAYYGISSDKTESYALARKFIKEIDPLALNQLRVGPGVSDKQVFDRCEAFLIANYGKDQYDYKMSKQDEEE